LNESPNKFIIDPEADLIEMAMEDGSHNFRIIRSVVRFIAGMALGLAWPSAIGFLVAAHAGFAQPGVAAQGAAAPPAFEVAPVKATDDQINIVFRVEHGNLTCRIGLKYLIAWAYGVPFQQVTAPDWAREATIEIFAKAGSPVAEDQVRLMLRTLLADRFKLTVHHETNDTARLALMVGKDGPHLTLSESEGPWVRKFDDLKYRETFTAVTMSEFTGFLAQYYNGALGRTGLAGRYDFVLDYRGLIEPTEQASPNRAIIELRREAIKQVGLQLQSVRAPLDFVVVDHLEKVPTEN
jgi:uncharacterized protein (TIGR03435 family)